MLITRYPFFMRLIHWLMAIIILTMLAVGFLMTGWWSDQSFTGNLYFWHKSFGILVLILITVRIFTKAYYAVKQQLPSMIILPAYERIVAHGVHALLYLFMIIMPLSGFLMSSFHSNRHGVPFFFTYLPVLLNPNPLLASYFAKIHFFSAYALIILLFLHLSGVIKHRLLDSTEKDSLNKML